MHVRLRFRGPLASRLAGNADVTIEDGSTLQQVLEKVLAEKGEIREIWDSADKIDREALLLRNETDVGLLDGLQTIIENDDEIVILPLVHGG